MATARSAGVAGALLGVALLAWSSSRSSPEGSAPSPEVPLPRAPAPPPGAARAPSPEASVPPPPGETSFVRAYRGRAASVAAACDLPLDTRCEGDTCVALMTAPDLDVWTGWVRLGLRSPRFVASTALRDLGVPVGALPCGAAVTGLVGDEGVRAVELPGGAEVWCAIDAAHRAEGWRAVGESLCTALGAEHLGDRSFATARPRRRGDAYMK